ncbi:NAD+ synthase [Merismopedia glauca]|uniref:Glutamine-dependent NAD(+) synthetase n=1 Tax=Merismopedia glauca CCAP 1448/3 TaxID=1296344 RepID=A0A2T1C7S2_9CYAN|nr:NAD+ synthase [Merismopedia glauca]PSB04208.1 NAD+ synthase [Merismopedia glauca CCAP 1448/3]
MKIAIAQLNPTIGDLIGNAEKILEAAQKAAKEGVNLLLTPELSLCGYPPRDLLLNPSFIQANQTTLAKLAEDLPLEIAVLVGTVEPNPSANISGGKPLFNASALLKEGQIQQIFHKRLLPTYDVFDEDRYFEPAKSSHSLIIEIPEEDPSGKTILTSYCIGVSICEDLWNEAAFWGKQSYPENPIADLANQKVDLIVNLSASPYSLGKQKIREAMLKHSSHHYQIPIIYANQVGGNDDLIFDGGSVAFNSQGELVCRGKTFESDLLNLNFDIKTQNLTSKEIRNLPETEGEEIWQALVLGVRDYARKCGFSKAVIGLSGGIDSALVAAIATFALGASNVFGVLMPSPYSSDHSISDALKLADNLGIKTQTLRIGELMKAYDENLEPLFAGTTFGIAEENIQSRIRGNLLMAIANKFGYLLLSTGNKSEMAVGYCTLYGDMNGGLAAIADVPKTRVYAICEWLNINAQNLIGKPEIIPKNIITKPPSAELKPGQLDRDSLPDYDTLDDILQRLIQNHQSPPEIIAAGHDEAIVNRVTNLVTKAEFKRRQAPPGLKITDRAFGTGWRMPIASRWNPL